MEKASHLSTDLPNGKDGDFCGREVKIVNALEKTANIDFKDIFFLIWDKYSDKVIIKHDDIDVDLILFSFEKALYKFIYDFIRKESIILWDKDYVPIVYLVDVDRNNQVYINNFSFNFTSKTYNLFLKLFTAELKRQILISSSTIRLKDFLNNLVVGTIAEIRKNQLIVIIDDIYNKYHQHIAGILESRYQPTKERSFYTEGKKLFFLIKNVKKDNYKRNVFLTRSSKRLTSSLIKNQMVKTIKSFQRLKKRPPILKCVKRVPNVYSIVISELRIPKNILDLTSKNLFKENIYVVNLDSINRSS